jgi:HAMP domain-containing protein
VHEQRRWVPVALVLLGLAFLAVVTVVGWRLVNPPVKGTVSSYDTLADDHMTLTFTVQRPRETPATCVVRARAQDGFDVAYTTVDLPAGQGTTSHTIELRTAYRALVGEVLGCGTGAVPSSVPGAQFRPGVVPPAQPWAPTSG